MTRLAFLILALASLACGLPVLAAVPATVAELPAGDSYSPRDARAVLVTMIEPSETTATVTADVLELRTSRMGTTVLYLFKGDTVTVLEIGTPPFERAGCKDNLWAYVRTIQRPGWVCADYLSK